MTKLISFVLPDLRGGGAERVAVNLANAFVSQGYDVDMVLMSCEGDFLSQLHPDIRLVDLSTKRARQTLLPLVRYLRDRQPSGLLAFMWPLTVIAVWARWLARVNTRVVVAEHTTWSTSPILRLPVHSLLLRTTMRASFPHVAGLVTVSKGAADDLARLTGLDRRLITTIYNPIVGNEPLTSEVPVNLPVSWWGGNHRRILAVGTLKEIKDYPTLLQAFALVRKQIDVRLLILGDGGCRSELELLAAKLGVADVVEFFGFVADPAPYYQRADLHVLSSRGEGFGNVIVEAMAAGTPVVSTDCPSGPQEILEGGRYGRLVPVGDVEALAEAMTATLREPVDKAALQARAQDFSIDKIAQEYLDLLLPERQKPNDCEGNK